MRPAVLLQVALARLREFVREPVALFWVYGFPQVVLLALGVAFTHRPFSRYSVALLAPELSTQQRQKIVERIEADPRLFVRTDIDQQSLRRVAASVLLEVQPGPQPDDFLFKIRYDPDRPDSPPASALVEAALLRVPGKQSQVLLQADSRSGSRYIDFLVPGLLAVGIMGGSLVGMGYTLVELRMRRLLRIYLATPLRGRELFAGLMLARFAFLIPEVLLVLLVAWALFGVVPQGKILDLGVILVLGTLSFLSLGLLIGARGRALEPVSGWLSLLMLVQWTFSGVFFSRLAYPESWQPVLRLLPLTALVDATRGILQEGQGLSALGVEVLVLLGWTALALPLGCWLFRTH